MMYKDNVIQIEILITNYFKGIFYGDINTLKNCFHKTAYLFGDIKDASYMKDVKSYIEEVNNRQSPNDLNEVFKMKIVGIDIIGKIALAKLHTPMLGYNYCDYLSLVKIDNEWKIVNKLFTHVE